MTRSTSTWRAQWCATRTADEIEETLTAGACRPVASGRTINPATVRLEPAAGRRGWLGERYL